MKIKGLDSAHTIYFEGELEKVINKVFEKKYRKLPFRRLLSVNRELSAADTHVTYGIYDAVGMAKIISAYATDLPRSDVSRKEVSFPIFTVGTSFGYNVQEIMASKATGKPLGRRRAEACRRATEEQFNRVALHGDAQTGMLGLFNNPNIPVANVVDPGSGTEWVNKTPAEILFDVNDMFADQLELTNEYEQARILLLPLEQWTYIATTQMPGIDKTILKFLVENSPWISSENQIQHLKDMKGAGVGGTDRMMAYDPDPEKVEFYIPMELDFLEAQQDGLELVVPGWARTGGTHYYYPLSATIRDGI